MTLSITNITESNHDQNVHHIKQVTVYQTPGPWANGSKVKNAQKLTKGYSFVKIMTPKSLKLHAHLQIKAKYSA